MFLFHLFSFRIAGFVAVCVGGRGAAGSAGFGGGLIGSGFVLLFIFLFILFCCVFAIFSIESCLTLFHHLRSG